MKNLIFLFIFFMTISCASNKGVYWCGDHPCINKKEKEAYFKKNMIVEMRSTKITDYKNNSEIEKLMQQAREKEKVRIKNEKSLSKKAKLEAKKLAKKNKLREKRLIKEEKELAKKIIKNNKKRIKNEKKLPTLKSDGNDEKQLEKVEISSSEFSEIVEKITKKKYF